MDGPTHDGQCFVLHAVHGLGTVPGPFIRARVGDALQVVCYDASGGGPFAAGHNLSPTPRPPRDLSPSQIRHTNNDQNGLAHNIDLHCVSGPGGGAPATYAEAGEVKLATFKLLDEGLYMYHCAAEPVGAHIANGTCSYRER